MVEKLTPAERDEHLPALGETGWGAVPERDAIRKIWKFRNFSEAWAFMSRVALAAEKMNHHPEWTNGFNTVDATLTTHDVRGLTVLDLRLARLMDRYAGAAEVQCDHSEPVSCLCQIRAEGREGAGEAG